MKKLFLKMGNDIEQKMFSTVTSIVLLILIASPISASEITIDWRQKLDSNLVNDLHFMLDDNYFIVGTGFDVQVRCCEDGNMVKGYSFVAWRIEFTPDSNRIVSIIPINGYKTLQLRNVNDMSLINEYVIPEDEEGYGVFFSEMKFTLSVPTSILFETGKSTSMDS